MKKMGAKSMEKTKSPFQQTSENTSTGGSGLICPGEHFEDTLGFVSPSSLSGLCFACLLLLEGLLEQGNVLSACEISNVLLYPQGSHCFLPSLSQRAKENARYCSFRVLFAEYRDENLDISICTCKR